MSTALSRSSTAASPRLIVNESVTKRYDDGRIVKLDTLSQRRLPPTMQELARASILVPFLIKSF